MLDQNGHFPHLLIVQNREALAFDFLYALIITYQFLTSLSLLRGISTKPPVLKQGGWFCAYVITHDSEFIEFAADMVLKFRRIYFYDRKG